MLCSAIASGFGLTGPVDAVADVVLVHVECFAATEGVGWHCSLHSPAHTHAHAHTHTRARCIRVGREYIYSWWVSFCGFKI